MATALHDVTDMRAAARRRARARLDEIERNRARYDGDFPVFAADCLTIRPKEGADRLFRLNAVQRRVHAEMEDQKRRTGRVRKLVLKARQPGVSTLITGRYYHRTSRNRGLRAFILTHDQDATDNVFEMVHRFHEHNPHAPHTGAASAKELYFDDLDSGFAVGTAGSKGVGRSFTFQLFHGSEVAYWPNAEEHAAGALQAVPDAEGTEVVLESTANGIGGLFYNKCMAAQRGVGEFEMIFIPWFEHDEYSSRPPENWRMPEIIADYVKDHELRLDQAHWLWRKNGELAIAEGVSADEICWRFRQEYPATVDEAFRASRQGAFISGAIVLKARKWNAPDQSFAASVLGVDLATGGDGEGGDDNVIIDRQGRKAGGKVYDRFNDKNTVSVASRLAGHIDKVKPDRTFIDVGGGGAQVHDILKDRGYDKIELVDFGSAADDDRKYANKRAEIYGRLRDWLGDKGGADMPDDDVLDGEITSVKAKDDFHTRTVLQDKAKVRKDIGHSPDGADALATTFAETVRKGERDVKPKSRGGGKRQSWLGA